MCHSTLAGALLIGHSGLGYCGLACQASEGEWRVVRDAPMDAACVRRLDPRLTPAGIASARLCATGSVDGEVVLEPGGV
jgi:hypothetical protein